MADKHRLNNQMYFTLTECPRTYPGPLEKIAAESIRRMSIYVDDVKMMIWDIYLTDQVRYEANLEVDPKFRNSEWMSLLLTSEPRSLESFSRPIGVWASTGEIIIEQEQALIDFHKQMTSKNIMRTGKIYTHGAINKIIDLAL